MHSIFQPGFPGMLEGIYVQERLIERFMPDVYQSFVRPITLQTKVRSLTVLEQTKHMISTTSYATKWYITLFANTLPFQTQLRLWDAFLLEGRDVIVIVAVAIVWVLRGRSICNVKSSFKADISTCSTSCLRMRQPRNYSLPPLIVLRCRRRRRAHAMGTQDPQRQENPSRHAPVAY